MAGTRAPLGIRARLALFGLAVSLPIVALWIEGVRRNNRAARAEAERTVAEFAERIATRLDARLNAFEFLLAAGARVIVPARSAAATNTASLAAIADRLDIRTEGNLVATDSLGWIVAWANPDRPLPQVNLSDRPHFQAVMRGERRVIGRPVRLRNDTTVWGVTIAEPIPGRNGRPAGMIGLTLRLSSLGQELDVPDLPAGTIVQLRDSVTVIGRNVDPRAWVGRDMPTSELFSRVAGGLRSERFRWGDDIWRYTAWREVSGSPRWQLAVGIPVELVDAPLDRDLALAWLVGVLAIGVAIGIGGWTGGRIVRPLRSLATEAERIASGRGAVQRTMPPSPDSVAEVATLSGAFDAMLAQVTARTNALQASEAMARLLFSQSPVPMWAADAATLTIRDANAAAAQLMGWSRDELVGRALESFRPVEDIGRWRLAVAAIGDHPTHLGQWRYITRDGSLRDIEVVATRLQLDGAPAYIAALLDVTEQRSAERALNESQEQLRQAQKMEALGRFAGGIAHDFNNLLTAILGQLEVTVDELPNDSPIRADLEPVKRSAERMAALTRQILAFGRRQVVQPVALDVCTVVREFEPTLLRLMPSGVDLAIACSPTPARIVADRAQVEQVLLNLAVNARDAMPDGGTITVSVELDRIDQAETTQAGRRGGPAVRLRVRDTGTGIEPSIVARIFEPFFTTKAPGKGTGLGLATVYAIMQQAGGVIRVDSTPGQGTQFDVLWLAAEAQDEGLKASSGPRAAVSGTAPRETVLVVDDEEGIRRLVSTALARLGYTVLTAADGAEAAEVAASHNGPIHLVVTDCVMPRMGGRELAAALRDVRPATKVLFVSGHTDDSALLAAIAADQAAFLPKPFTPGTLTARVREVLDG